MSRGRSSPSEHRSGKRPHRRPAHASRDRALLLALLAAIAILLGTLIALLPDAVQPSDEPAISTPGSSPGSAGHDVGDATDATESTGGTGEGDGGTGTGSARAWGADDSPDARSRDGEGGAPPSEVNEATEAYPAGERPADATVPESASGDAYWWLPANPVPAAARGELVLVLDDAGNSLDGFSRFLEFPGPLTIAVLPLLEYSVQASAMTAAAGKEIILHQPMEALNGADPGPGAIGPGMSDEEILERLTENLATVPGAIGANNHMGSRATADADVMQAVLAGLEARELFFLDSRTSSETVGRPVSALVGIPFAERTVFLDNERTRDAILGALAHALERAQRGEPVVMIGHVTGPVLAEVLNEVYPILIDAGYRFAPLSSVVEPVRVASGDDS